MKIAYLRVFLMALIVSALNAFAQTTEFTYQGRLIDAGRSANGVYDLVFQIYDAPTKGNLAATAITNTAVQVGDGFFTTQLDFGPRVFTGAPLWVEVGVRTNRSLSSFTTLSPRQPVTASPYAIHASTADSSRTATTATTATTLSGTFAGDVSGPLDATIVTRIRGRTVSASVPAANQILRFDGSSWTPGAVALATDVSGTLPDARLSLNIPRLNAVSTFTSTLRFDPPAGPPFAVGSTNKVINLGADLLDGFEAAAFWNTLGNAGTDPGSNFVGTTDNRALEFRVNNLRALRLEPNGSSPNIIGGLAANTVSSTSVGAVIAGGGSTGNSNYIAGNYSVIGGGRHNRATGLGASVGGGEFNQAVADGATVAGGNSITASGSGSAVGGGGANFATNSYATIPGGLFNVAGGQYSFAAGHHAKAFHDGAFVWSDAASSADFTSTALHQFLIRATGGVGIGLNNPAAALDVNGRVRMTQFQLGSSATAGQVLTADSSGVGVWQNPAFVSKSGDTLNGDLTISNPSDLNFGSSTRQMINLWGANYGIGVQNNTLYQRSDGGFAWFRLGSHINTPNSPGAGGSNLMWLDSNGSLFANSSLTVDAPSANNGGILPGLVFGQNSGEGLASKRTAGGNQHGLDFYTGFSARLSIANNGNVGIGSTAPSGKLDINTGNGTVQFISDLVPGINVTGGSIPGVLRLRNSLEIWPSQDATRPGSLDVRDSNGSANISLRGNGTATVKVLEITGGADIAEPFKMSGVEAIQKGAVVVIDDQNPGQLKLSKQAYDSKVAGIVSGANGIQPGLALHQQGVVEGGHNVALTGRVYALADASDNPIKPGDLLTTSDTPGHLMKAADRERAPGTVLGKAMTGLENGKGMVLVLVSLQ